MHETTFTTVPAASSLPRPTLTAGPDPALLEREIAELSSHLDAATHRLLTCIRDFDASGAWAGQGALSCGHWLSWRVGMNLGAAREKVRVARALAKLPTIDGALSRGEVSYSKVRAMTRVATAKNEARLLDMATRTTAGQLERVCRKFRQVQDGGRRTVLDENTRWVSMRGVDGKMVQVTAMLFPEEAALVMKAIEAAARSMTTAGRADGDWQGSEGSAETRPDAGDRLRRLDMADGLVALAEGAGAGTTGAAAGKAATTADAGAAAGAGTGDAGGGTAPRATAGAAAAAAVPMPVEVLLRVSAAVLADGQADDHVAVGDEMPAELADGTGVSAETARRLSCDAKLVRVTEDERGQVLDVGRKTRVIPTAIRRALRLRDGGCRFPGCDNHRFVDGHHIRHWARGGATRLSNLVELCRRHHRFVHEYGYAVEATGDGDGEFVFRDAHHRVVDACPLTPRAPIRPVETLFDNNRDRDVCIDDKTAFPLWDGASVDYSRVIDALLEAPGALGAADHGG